MLKKEDKKAIEKEQQFDELMSCLFDRLSNEKATPRTVSWDEERLIGYVDEMLHLHVFLITLLSRKLVDNKLNTMLTLHVSKKAGELIGLKKANKEHEHYKVILSLCMEEGYLFLTALQDTMRKAQETRNFIFKDEIRAIEDYLKREWSLYLNTNPENIVTT